MHRSTQYWDQVDRAKRCGFTVKQLRNGQIAVYPPDKSIQFYISHSGEKALHPLRRFIDNTLKKMRKELI